MRGAWKLPMTVSTTDTIGGNSPSARVCDVGTAARLDTVLVKTASRCNIDCSYCYVYQGPDTMWRLQPKRMGRDVVEAVCERLVEQAGRQEAGLRDRSARGRAAAARLRRARRSAARPAGSFVPRSPPHQYPDQRDASQREASRSLFRNTHERVRQHRRTSRSQRRLPGSIIAARAHSQPRCGVFAFWPHTPSANSCLPVRFRLSSQLSIHGSSTSSSRGWVLRAWISSSRTGNHDRTPQGKSQFNSTEYGQWLIGLFDLYLSDPSPVPIRLVDDTIKLCIGGTSRKEGSGKEQHGILIIETDGEIRKNDTLRASFEGADQFGIRWNVTTTPLSRVLSSHEYVAYAGMQMPTCSQCAGCDLLAVCGGGMPLYRWSTERGYDNPSVYCHDHAAFIRHAVTRLHEFGLNGSLVASPPTIDVS